VHPSSICKLFTFKSLEEEIQIYTNEIDPPQGGAVRGLKIGKKSLKIPKG
jgi:hypothetical protein